MLMSSVIYAQKTSLTVDCQTPGWLSSKINYGDQQTVKNLIITGYVNQTDISFIGTLMEKQSLNGHLDLTNAIVVDTKYSEKETSTGVEMFNLSKKVSISRLSLPKSLPSISPYLLALVEADTLDYGSSNCCKLTPFLTDNAYYNSNISPRVLILREGVSKIERFYNSRGKTKENLQTIILPQTLDSIGKNAFQGVENLVSINLPNNIHTIEDGAFEGTSFIPDTLDLPLNLKTFYTNSFTHKKGQVIIIKENVEKFDNENWYINKYTNLTFVIHCITPPVFRKGAKDSAYYPSYSDGKELSGCTIYVPKESFNLYSDPTYDSVGGTAHHWSGWANPYSYAKLQTIYVPASSIKIDSESIELIKGMTKQLSAIVLPTDADSTEYSWSSSNSNIVSVSSTGVITANSSGEAYVIATLNADSTIVDSCKVNVIQPVTSIALNTKEKTLNVGETYTLYVTVNPNDADNKNIIWTSENPEIASIENGTIKALRAGIVKIIATSEDNNNATDYCEVIVNQPTIGISLNYSEYTIEGIGETIQLEALVFPEDATNKNVNWKSSNENVCVVSNGKVVAVGYGTSIIIATTVDGGHMATCVVIVKNKEYLLTYVLDGKVYYTESLAEGEVITPLEEPTKEGHTFSGWSEIPGTMPADNVTITGTFTVNQYNVIFIIDGAEFATVAVNYGESIAIPEVPAREGYAFAWTDEIPETMPAKDIVINGAYSIIDDISNVVVKDEILYIYTLDGLRINELRKGLNIVWMKDGSVRKVFVE